jgi:hypothetical protein
MMDTMSSLTPKQTEAVDTLFDLNRESRKDTTEARTALRSVSILLAQQNVLDYLVAALLKLAKALNIIDEFRNSEEVGLDL